jgi:hypothetical protein
MDNSQAFNNTVGDAILGGETRNDGHVSFADPAVNGFHTLNHK